MAVSISSMFCIEVQQTIAAGSSLTITNPGRTLQIVEVAATGGGTASYTLSKVESGVETTVAEGFIASDALSGESKGNVKLASSSVTASGNLKIAVAAGGSSITGMRIVCIGSPSQALTAA